MKESKHIQTSPDEREPSDLFLALVDLRDIKEKIRELEAKCDPPKNGQNIGVIEQHQGTSASTNNIDKVWEGICALNDAIHGFAFLEAAIADAS